MTLDQSVNGFTIGSERHFGLSHASVIISRAKAEEPIYVHVNGRFMGIDNLEVDVQFNLDKPTNISALVEFSVNDNVQRRNSERKRSLGMFLFILPFIIDVIIFKKTNP